MDRPDDTNANGKKAGKVLVTGASGFIGGHVARYLAHQGLAVSCLVRDPAKARFISDLPVGIIQGDITDPDNLQQAFRGMDMIVHTAGKVNDWGSFRDFYEVNVNGTLNVLKAAVNNSVKKVIITGSVSSYGEEDFNGLKDESSPYNSHYPYFPGGIFPSGMNHYRDTKALCTQKAIEFAEKNGLDLIILEPVWVYGENEFNSGFYEYIKTVKSGVFLMPGRSDNTFHVIYAGDLARAYYQACTCNLSGTHRIIIGNHTVDNMQHIYRIFCREAGLKMPLLLPRFITYPIGFILELLFMAFRSKKPPVLTRARVNMLYDSIGYNTSKSIQLFRLDDMITLEEGIKKTIKWYRDNQLI